MAYDLRALAKQQRKPRRKSVTLREVAAPQGYATDLYLSCYKPIVDLWAASLPAILSAYERTLGEITTDSPADVQAELSAAKTAFQRLFFLLTPALRTWALKTEAVTKSRWRGAVLAATGVDLTTLLGAGDERGTIESYLEWNTALIRDVHDQTRKRIADRVFAGLTERKPAREVAKEIREAVGMARDRSHRIAADQLNKLSSSMADERRREAGLDVWMWLHSGKKHPRKEHQARDGRLYTDNSALVGKRVDGKVVNKAPERGDMPGQAPYCGCRSRGVLVFEFDSEA